MKLSLQYLKGYHNHTESGLVFDRNYLHRIKPRPDSIRIRFEKYENENISNKLISLFKSKKYHEPFTVNFSWDPSIFEIDAALTKDFLNLLIQLKNIYRDELAIDKNEFEKLLNDLAKNNYITVKDVQYYKHKVPNIFSIKDSEEYAKTHRDFMQAVYLALHYKNSPDSDWFPMDRALFWLQKAIEFKPHDSRLESVLDLDGFFDGLTRFHTSAIFTSGQEIFEAVKRSQSLKELDFNKIFGRFQITSNMTEYLAATKSLEKLEISAIFFRTDTKLTDDELMPVINGLEKNTSLKTLSIKNETMTDKGLVALIEALEKNPQSDLRTLELDGNEITNMGALRLLEFLTHQQTKISKVNLLRNTINPEIIKKINDAIQPSVAKEQAEFKLSHSSSAGLFAKKSEVKPLNKPISEPEKRSGLGVK